MHLFKRTTTLHTAKDKFHSMHVRGTHVCKVTAICISFLLAFPIGYFFVMFRCMHVITQQLIKRSSSSMHSACKTLCDFGKSLYNQYTIQTSNFFSVFTFTKHIKITFSHWNYISNHSCIQIIVASIANRAERKKKLICNSSAIISMEFLNRIRCAQLCLNMPCVHPLPFYVFPFRCSTISHIAHIDDDQILHIIHFLPVSNSSLRSIFTWNTFQSMRNPSAPNLLPDPLG